MANAAFQIVPRGIGETKPLSIRFPVDLLRRLDACAAETDNSRSEVVVHMVAWALDQYEEQRAAERQGR